MQIGYDTVPGAVQCVKFLNLATQDTPIRSPFRTHCEKIPLSQIFLH